MADKNVEHKLGSEGLSGIQSISMYHWLLKFGGTNARLRKSIAELKHRPIERMILDYFTKALEDVLFRK